MRRTKLLKRDVEICQRLREAREKLGFSQTECARQIGLERSTLLNYEHCRTPLRFEVALRFCRQFIVSEEWLATGRYDACHAEAPKHGVVIGPGIEEADRLLFFRQCMDLLSEPAALHIPPGTLFGEAYDKFLAPEYARLLRDFFYFPRLLLSDSDIPELVCNLLNAINERFINLLANEALRRGQKQSSAWRVYARCLLESADLVFRKMMRFKLDSKRLNDLDWLRRSVTDPEAFIEFLEERGGASSADPAEFDLTDSSLKGKSLALKSEVDKLIEQVRRKASKPGAKSELAKFLDVDPPRISEWLSGKKEPGGDYALRLKKWVESPVHQK